MKTSNTKRNKLKHKTEPNNQAITESQHSNTKIYKKGSDEQVQMK